MKRTNRKFLGMLTPSSNTLLEPVCSNMLAGLPEVTAHAGRFRVTEISLGTQALGQFTNAPMITASQLLADAKCHSICWNGTSAGWLGFDSDRKLCTDIRSLADRLCPEGGEKVVAHVIIVERRLGHVAEIDAMNVGEEDVPRWPDDAYVVLNVQGHLEIIPPVLPGIAVVGQDRIIEENA